MSERVRTFTGTPEQAQSQIEAAAKVSDAALLHYLLGAVSSYDGTFDLSESAEARLNRYRAQYVKALKEAVR